MPGFAGAQALARLLTPRAAEGVIGASESAHAVDFDSRLAVWLTRHRRAGALHRGPS